MTLSRKRSKPRRKGIAKEPDWAAFADALSAGGLRESRFMMDGQFLVVNRSVYANRETIAALIAALGVKEAS